MIRVSSHCAPKRTWREKDCIFFEKELTVTAILSNLPANAEVVELVDTLASGASGGNPVEVRVLFSVPLIKFKTLFLIYVTHYSVTDRVFIGDGYIAPNH